MFISNSVRLSCIETLRDRVFVCENGEINKLIFMLNNDDAN